VLATMTPGFLLSLGTSFFWQWMDLRPSLWTTALGTNVIWVLPFGFLVMIAVWNRYDDSVEEASRDLGTNAWTTFREVTLPLVWIGVFGTFLFGFTRPGTSTTKPPSSSQAAIARCRFRSSPSPSGR